MKPTEHNEMENKALKEHLASAALQMLAEGTDYENLAGTTCRFYQDLIFDTKEKAFSGVKIPKKA